jgi:hypothetical protein
MGVLLGIESASIVFIHEGLATTCGNVPGYGERIKGGSIGVVGAFAFERTKSVHERDRDVGKDGSPTRGNLVLGERRDEARKEDRDITGGTKLFEIADEIRGGILRGFVTRAERNVLGSGGGATAPSRLSDVAAARQGFAFHDGTFRGSGRYPRFSWPRVCNRKKEKGLGKIREMEECESG